MTFLMLAGRMPTENEARMTDALLNILVEHGMLSSVVAARLTYATAPEAMQGAVAAALLGAGSVHLGSFRNVARRWLVEGLAGDGGAISSRSPSSVVERHAARKQRIPGIGHRTYPLGDPRARRLFDIARETGAFGRYCEFLYEIVAAAEARRETPPPELTGAIASIALDMGFQWQITKAFTLIGRTLGAIAHISEGMRNPMAGQINAAIRLALVYETDGK